MNSPDKPALLGGTPVRTEPLHNPNRALGPAALEYLADICATGQLTRVGGKYVDRLEAEFADWLGVKFCTASSSGTAAIHTALGALQLEPGDEVICAPITDMGTVIPVLAQNAIPVFADILPETYNMDPVSAEQRVTARTRAIMPVHLAGNPADMAALRDVAARHGLLLVEDCAQAYGALWQGEKVGTLGDIGCFSLQQSKHLISGQGGLTVTNDPVLQEILSIFPHKGGPHYSSLGARNYLQFGYNYHLTELQAAVALSQLPGLEALCARRAFLGDRLNAKLAGLPGFYPQVVREGDRCTYWMYVLRVVAEEAAVPAPKVAEALRAEGVACGYQYIGKPIFMYEAIRRQQVYGTSNYPFTLRDGEPLRYDEEYCPGCVQALDEMVVIPIHELYTDEDIDQIAEACAKIATWAW